MVDVLGDPVQLLGVVHHGGDPANDHSAENHPEQGSDQAADRDALPVTPGFLAIFSPTKARISRMTPSTSAAGDKIAVRAQNSAAGPNTKANTAAALVLAGRVGRAGCSSCCVGAAGAAGAGCAGGSAARGWVWPSPAYGRAGLLSLLEPVSGSDITLPSCQGERRGRKGVPSALGAVGQPVATMAARRFCCRPAAVLFGATGSRVLADRGDADTGQQGP